MATLDGVHPSLASRITWMQQKAAQDHGTSFWVNTGWRSPEEQKRLYQAMLDAIRIYGEPEWRQHAALAAIPGQSNHQHMTNGQPDSLAVDLGCAPKDNGLRITLAQQAGLCTPVAGEPWHLEERANAALPNPPSKDNPVDQLPYIICPCPTGGFWELKKSDGGVANQFGAPFFGSLPGVRAKVVSPLVGMTACVRGGVVLGYWIFDLAGNVYAFGNAPFFTSYALHPEWHAPNRNMAGLVQTAGFNPGERIRYAQIGIEQGDADYVVDTYDIGLELKR